MKNRAYLDLREANTNELDEFVFKDFVNDVRFYEDNHEINFTNIDISSLPEKIELCDLDGNVLLEEDGTPVLLNKKTAINIINLKLIAEA